MRVGEVKRRLRKSLLQCVKVRTQANMLFCLANPKLYVFMIDENVRGRVLNDGRKDPPSLDELPVPIYPGNIQCMLMTCHSKQPEGLLHETDWMTIPNVRLGSRRRKEESISLQKRFYRRERKWEMRLSPYEGMPYQIEGTKAPRDEEGRSKRRNASGSWK